LTRAVGGIALLFSLFVDVKGGLTNSEAQLLSGGVLLFGLGEWKNHKQQQAIKPPNAYTGGVAVITRTYWKPDLGGILLDLLGVFLVGEAVLKLWRH
jgi:hypothetical protein